MKKMLKLVVCFSVVLISGCIWFESIDQPTSALPGEIIIVSIYVTTEGGDYEPYFGVCLPNGWTIPGDSIPCTGVYNETIYYDSLVSLEQNNASPAPEGYYWWAGAGAGVLTDPGSVYGQIEIQTDSQVGLFSIDYMLGNSYDGVNQERSNDHLIGIADEYTPRGLQAIVEGNLVVLNWKAPFNTEGLLGYNIYRNEQQINTILIADTTFTDEDPLDGIHYYAVSSLYDDGIEHLIPYEAPVFLGENLYVSLDGNDSNSGSSFEDALLTINYALSIITTDSLHPITIFLAPGIYSPSTNGEVFPFEWKNYLSLEGTIEEETILDADGLNGIMRFGNITNAIIRNITLRNGSAGWQGGGIYCYYSSPSLVNVTISGNTACYEGEGGGIYCDGSSPSLVNVTISGNSADRGGGIFCWYSSPSLGNVTISGNTANYVGGGIYCGYLSNLSSENVIISGNTADVGGGGICCYYSNPSLVNCILWNDTPQEIYIESGSVTATYSDVQGGWTGTGNIDEDPMFVSGPLGDYHLCPFTPSPCIDAGNPDPMYNDPEDPLIPGYAMWPALGTVRNDMGVYGGPNTDVWTGVEEDEDLLPNVFFLNQNYPNPFKLQTTIKYALPEDIKVSLKVYNILGREIKILVNELKHSGFYQIVWDGRDNSGKTVPCGVYFLKFDAGKYTTTKKLLKVR